MKIFLVLLLFFCLLLIFWQDIKIRKIYFFLPLVVFLLNYFLTLISIKEIFINILFFISTMGLLILYMSLKKKQFLNPFENYFGLGDFLFYLAITPLFTLRHYVIFFIGSMIFSIIIQKIFKKYINQSSIPLAGLASVLLACIISKDLLYPINKITLLYL